MTDDQLILGAVQARLAELKREVAAQTDTGKGRIAELSASGGVSPYRRRDPDHSHDAAEAA